MISCIGGRNCDEYIKKNEGYKLFKSTRRSQSDGIQNNRDGWMLDNITWMTYWEGMPEIIKDCKIFPNPGKDFIEVEPKIKIKEFSIISEFGQTIISKSIDFMPSSLDIRNLNEGIYFLKITTEDNNIIMRKFIKSD